MFIVLWVSYRTLYRSTLSSVYIYMYYVSRRLIDLRQARWRIESSSKKSVVTAVGVTADSLCHEGWSGVLRRLRVRPTIPRTRTHHLRKPTRCRVCWNSRPTVQLRSEVGRHADLQQAGGRRVPAVRGCCEGYWGDQERPARPCHRSTVGWMFHHVGRC